MLTSYRRLDISGLLSNFPTVRQEVSKVSHHPAASPRKLAHLTPIDGRGERRGTRTKSKCQIRRSAGSATPFAPPLRRSMLRRSTCPPVSPLPSSPRYLADPLRSNMSSTRFIPRRWRKFSFILLLFINLFAISILSPHLFNNHVPRRWEWDWRFSDRHSLHRLQSDGRLEVNMQGRHPILELMALGEAKWNRMIQRYNSVPSHLLQLN